MDAKALAKSKRAHSQHHKNKSHSHHKSKAPAVASDNAGSKEKQLGKQVGAETRQSRHTSRLPSNWDRYEDEFDLDSENPSGDSPSQPSDMVVPKSKGADYRHLIAEAQSQSQSQSYAYSDTFPSLDDVMPGNLAEGFIQGVGSMLKVRGEGILSWTEEDNFILEDKRTAFQEASFLSLNLNALAEQLAKVDLSQRLFVEADLLPSEPDAEGSMACSNQESGQAQTQHESETAADISKDRDIAFEDFPEGEEETMVHKIEAAADIAKDDLNSSQSDKLEQSKAFEAMERFNENSVTISKNLPKFEATAAEAELDKLLDSFGDIFCGSQQTCASAQPQPDLPKTASAAATYDDVLDDLFVQTSSLTKQSQLCRKEVDLPKTASGTASFDDVLDELLDETSNPMNQNGLSQSRDVKVVPHETKSSSSHSMEKSKVLEDFDSWLDTI